MSEPARRRGSRLSRSVVTRTTQAESYATILYAYFSACAVCAVCAVCD
jgi:hypothetical protein